MWRSLHATHLQFATVFKMQSVWFLDNIKSVQGDINKEPEIRTDPYFIFYVFRKSGKKNKNL